MIDVRNFWSASKKWFKNIWKLSEIETGQGDVYATGCLLDYNCFKNYHKMTAIDLIKQQALDTGPKSIQQINFTGNLDRAEGATILFILKNQVETILIFSQGTVSVL